MRRLAALLLMLCVVAIAWQLTPEPMARAAEAKISNFTLKDQNGKDVSLADFKDKKAIAVIFVGTECPLVQLYALRLRQLHEELAPKGVQLLAINSNVQDTAERVAEHAKQREFSFPVLKDTDQKVADLFQAARTPEAFVLDKDGVIRYRGRIDDQFGIGFQRAQPTRRDLAEALNELIAGKPVSVAKTEVMGCKIGRDKKADATSEITYTKHVARILQQNCQECHRPGQIGPFSLLTYEKAKAWSDTIAEVVQERRMPPWHADPKHGKWSNDRSMSAEDRTTLLAWIERGCPKGDEKDMPPPREFRGTDGWRIGKPDAIFTMKEEFKVPAVAPKGGVPYQFFMVPTNFEQDMWVQAAEAKPGQKAVVHHIIAYIMEPGKRFAPDKEDGLGKGLLVATAPGDIPTIYKDGYAKLVPKGATLAFQMHYTPNGEEVVDRSSVGVIFAKKPPEHIVRTRSPMNRYFQIPAGDGNYKVECSNVFEKEAMLINFMPHMHLRGKSFEYRVRYPDGKTETLLSIPRYDFGWQTYYNLAEPLKLPAGTKIECTAHFDNSDKNLNNPDPTKIVRWGDQTWEEMMIGWLDYYYTNESPSTAKAEKGN